MTILDVALDGVVSHVMATGLFDRVNLHEPANAPGNGLSAAVWVQDISPCPTESGLAATTSRVELTVRLYSNMFTEPRDYIDPNILKAASEIIAALSADFTLGDMVRNIDLLGAVGTPLSGKAGYLSLDNKLYRVMDVTVPILINDLWEQIAAASSTSLSYVEFITAGSAFLPVVELAVGSSGQVVWHAVEDDVTAVGTEPTLNFGSSATRHVRMMVTEAGVDLIGDVTTINIGYDHNFDAGRYAPGGGDGSEYDKASELVTSVTGLTNCTGLVNFLASGGPLANSLDFTGLSALQFIECGNSDVTGVTLDGCTSLIRLCVEACNLTTLDLNPVADCVYDLRGAIQQGGVLTLTPLSKPLAHDYHFCFRDQELINHPTGAQLPVVEQLWNWNTQQTGSFTLVSTVCNSWLGYENSWDTISLAGTYAYASGGVLWLHSNTSLTSINITDCQGIGNLDLHGCAGLDQSDVDGILATLDAFGTSNRTVNLLNTFGPSAAGKAHATSMIGRGWTVTVDTTTFFDDEMDRVAASIAAMNSPTDYAWAGTAGASGTLDGAAFIPGWNSSYQLVRTPTLVTLPADYTIWTSLRIPGSGFQYTFFTARHNSADNTGLRVGWQNLTTLQIGNSTGPFTENTQLTFTPPATWAADNAFHDIQIVLSGTSVTLYLKDGTDAWVQAARSANGATWNAASTGLMVGFGGDMAAGTRVGYLKVTT